MKSVKQALATMSRLNSNYDSLSRTAKFNMITKAGSLIPNNYIERSIRMRQGISRDKVLTIYFNKVNTFIA